jgi:hypothetical protein
MLELIRTNDQPKRGTARGASIHRSVNVTCFHFQYDLQMRRMTYSAACQALSPLLEIHSGHPWRSCKKCASGSGFSRGPILGDCCASRGAQQRSVSLLKRVYLSIGVRLHTVWLVLLAHINILGTYGIGWSRHGPHTTCMYVMYTSGSLMMKTLGLWKHELHKRADRRVFSYNLGTSRLSIHVKMRRGWQNVWATLRAGKAGVSEYLGTLANNQQ